MDVVDVDVVDVDVVVDVVDNVVVCFSWYC